MAAPSSAATASAASDDSDDAAFISSTVCFKCAGQGILHTKKRKRPGLPAVAAAEGEGAGQVTVLSEGNKAVHLQRSCPVCQGTGRVVSRRKARAMTIEGVITTRRRPPGFVMKGPVPPAERVAAAQPEKGEALCYLTGEYRIYQPLVGHRYSTDDVVTAWAAGKEARHLLLPALSQTATNGPDGGNTFRGLDLGTGLGSVLLMMCWQFPAPAVRYVGVEAQGRNAERARRSCWVNGCESRAEIRHGDIRGLFDAGAGEPPVPAGERAFDIVTGTPPYFDAHGAPTPSDPADPPISITSLPGSDHSGEGDQVARKAASGKARTQPVPLPAAEDQRPCNFELRGGVEVYCHAAKASLAPHGLFIMCASDLPGVEARVRRAADDAGLSILRKLAVLPKRGQPPLFAVYTLCHAGGVAAEAYAKALVDAASGGGDGPKPRMLLVDPLPTVEAEAPRVEAATEDSGCLVREILAVREAGPVGDGDGEGGGGGGGRVPRTAEYRRVMDDLSMPDNEA